MTINNATVEQINVALLDIDKRIKALNADSETLKSLQNSVKTIKGSLNGTTTTTGMLEALTVNGKTYNGSKAVDAGVQIVKNGGTGVTTQEEINKAFISNLAEGGSDVTDSTEFVSSYANDNGFSEPGALNTPFKRKFSTVWNYIKDKISSVLGLTKDNYDGKASTAGTADKAVEVVDYGDTSRTVKVGFAGSSVAADKLDYLAGYTEGNGSSIKIKDVKRTEVIKWLSIPTLRYVDYRTEDYKFTSLTDSKKIELSCFGSDVKEDNVLGFMVIYWNRVPIIAQGDWAKSQGTGSSGLACRLYPLDLFNADTGYCVVRCVYIDNIAHSTIH